MWSTWIINELSKLKWASVPMVVDQIRRKLSKNGEKATLWEQKRNVNVILAWADILYWGGGAWAKPSKAFPLNYPRAIRKRVSRAVARLCSLPLILFFVGYNVRGENACPSVPLLPHGFDCPFQNEKVKGCLRQFFSMLPIADPQAEAHGSIEKNKPLTISFFHFQSHPRGSKLHCISGEIHARIYPLDKWLATCYIMCSGYIASSLNG